MMQAKRVLILVAIVALASTVASADVVSSNQTARMEAPIQRTNGTLGAFSASIVQTGPLQADYSATVTTVGGDGVPFVGVTTSGATVTLDDQVRVAAQLYDSPWTAHTWTTFNGQNFLNSPTALGSFTATFSVTVPKEANYQVWAAAIAGVTWPTGGTSQWGFISQGISGQFYTITSGPFGTAYIDSTQPPTPTFNPDAGGIPIPTLGALGTISMVLLLAGVALLVIVRRH
jgi:hypothetical protein